MNNHAPTPSSTDSQDMNFSMKVSFLVGLFMLIIKCFAYYLTNSTAILSDAAESIIHVFAVGFAVYSMWLSLKPADANHLYGHEKVSFFSAGFEGAMIFIAALYIYYEAVQKFIYGIELENIGIGIVFIVIAITINFILGTFLIRKGKRYNSIILESNGTHILTDCLTSIGVLIALILVQLTGMVIFDPIVAFLTATSILWTGWKLMKRSVNGLMDQTDPVLNQQITSILNKETSKKNLAFHHLRHRMSGNKIFIEFHLLFKNDDISLKSAHEIASEIEAKIRKDLGTQTEISSHLEPIKHHDDIHKKYELPV